MTSRIGARGITAVVVALAIVGAASFSTEARESQQDQESRRLRQLAVFEELLTETVQARVTDSVNDTIDAARRGDADGDGVAEGVAAEPLVVKIGKPLAAHGLYIDGYGVMFSIQTPQVSVIPQSFAAVWEAPRSVFRIRGAGMDLTADAMGGVIEMRADMIDRSIDDLIVLLERQPGELHQVRVQELEGVLQNIRVTLEPLRREQEAEETAEANATDADEALIEIRQREEAAQDAATRAYGRARGLDRTNRWVGYYRDSLEHRDDMKVVLERNHRQVAAAMNAAALETLANYGALIKGLEDDERISVVVLPPNTWSFARGYGVGDDQGEHIVSARYKDIRELDDEKIDYGEFVKRAQIRNRLGLEVSPATDPEQD